MLPIQLITISSFYWCWAAGFFPPSSTLWRFIMFLFSGRRRYPSSANFTTKFSSCDGLQSWECSMKKRRLSTGSAVQHEWRRCGCKPDRPGICLWGGLIASCSFWYSHPDCKVYQSVSWGILCWLLSGNQEITFWSRCCYIVFVSAKWRLRRGNLPKWQSLQPPGKYGG